MHIPFKQALENFKRRQVLLVGIEAHVCVYQTARDLKNHGYEVFLAEDAVSSKSKENKDNAVARMRQEGIVLGSTEMFACDLIENADHPKFREIMANIKR